MNNYIDLHSFSLRYKHYVFIDTEKYFYKQIFSEREIKVKALKEMMRDGFPYRLILCKVLKRDEKIFINALEQIQRKALLVGYRGYTDMCEMLLSCEKRLQEADG